jgi:hypothetical protein
VKVRRSSSSRRGLAKAGLSAIILAAITFVAAVPAFAGLGEDGSSVDADQARMQATRRTTSTTAYTLHEIQAPTGIVVREYVSPAGKVFGVAWHGPWPPNMRQILANYFAEFQQAAQLQTNTHPGRRPFVIERPELVIHSAGHLRSFGGNAYIPELIPAGVSPEAIQ